MTETPSRYHLDLRSNSCRIRIDGAKPGKHVKVLVRDSDKEADPSLHGTGVRSEDASVFTITFPTSEGETTVPLEWARLKTELAKYPRYD